MFVGIVIMTLCCFTVGQGLNSGTSVYLAQRGASATLAGVGAAVFSAAAAAVVPRYRNRFKAIEFAVYCRPGDTRNYDAFLTSVFRKTGTEPEQLRKC